MRGAVLALLLAGGCAPMARGALFASAPSFELVVDKVRGGFALYPDRYLTELVKDDLCDGDDEDCEEDLFVGFAFYRSDTGIYGNYREIARVMEPELLDVDGERESFWRAAIIRDGEEDGLRIEAVSEAGFLEPR